MEGGHNSCHMTDSEDAVALIFTRFPRTVTACGCVHCLSVGYLPASNACLPVLRAGRSLMKP